MNLIERAGSMLFIVAFILTNPANAGSSAESPQSSAAPAYRRGLAAHYFKDHDQWKGQWPQESNVPFDDPVNWTFTAYNYSRVEPLINHLFIRQGWFSIRWVGWLDPSPGAHSRTEQEYTFEIWADDGTRLFINGEKLIDDWNARWEEAPEAWRRSRPVRLSPGKHRIVVEYFQGLSQEEDDNDPMKLYWSSPSRGFERQIIPAAHFHHTAADLQQYNRPADTVTTP